MKASLLKTFAVLVACAMPVVAQTNNRAGSVYTPPAGSVERKAIVDALRVPVEKELKQKVVFKFDRFEGGERFKVQDGWALLMAKPQQPDGKPVNYRITPYQSNIEDGVFDEGVYALLRKQNGKWRVVEYAIGSTDVPFTEWDGAPPALFKSFFEN